MPLEAPITTKGLSVNSGPAEDDPFDDFDGVHFTRNSRSGDSILPNTSINEGKRESRSTKEQSLSNDRGDLVYYPAPVPVMLNLPPKLSNARLQNQAQGGHEEVRARRESLSSFRRSLALKASHSKAEASSLFDNILDATVVSPVLSVVSHSVTNSKPPSGNNDHIRSASKLSFSGLRLEDSSSAPRSSAHLHQQPGIGDNGGDDIGTDKSNDDAAHDYDHVQNPDGILSHLKHETQKTDFKSKIKDCESVKDSGMITGDIMESRSRASQYPHSNSSCTEGGGEAEAEGEGEGEGGRKDDIHFTPATLLAELESRKTQQRARTNKFSNDRDTRQMSTLLERDAIAEVKQKARKRGPVNLAWQADKNAVEEEEDDVPLGLLYAGKLSTRPNEVLRTPGLLAMREAEDNEPLRRRQERLKHLVKDSPDLQAVDTIDDKETLGQRRSRLQAAQRQREESALDREEPEAAAPATINSMSAILHSNPQRNPYVAQQDISSRGLLNPELPFGYQAQQQMHGSFMGNSPSSRQPPYQRKSMAFHQHDYTTLPKARDYEFGIPFPYAPVNAEYLQHQQALLTDQIERWRSSVW
ncbi:hypothetical protein AA313_de0209526 [Arthrobotrys entomopaga]|nr:hypothetical protein AA313_de0209526 [Arthrobotrys entomopaga]